MDTSYTLSKKGGEKTEFLKEKIVSKTSRSGPGILEIVSDFHPIFIGSIYVF